MKRYVEEDKTIEVLFMGVRELGSDVYYGSSLGVPEEDIEDIFKWEIPAENALNIVRCKECEHYNKENCFCSLHSVYMEENDFCSKGKELESLMKYKGQD